MKKQKKQRQKFDGALLAARYAFMPNQLRYCGGDKNSQLFDYLVEDVSDLGLTNMLGEFATMYPYLKLIAQANHIFDPFNYRVVEAYWIGNDLLNNVSMKGLYRHMIDGQNLKKKFKPKILEKVFGKIPVGAKPHHSWHVFNIPKSVKHYPVEHTLATMDDCRIGWGQIKKSKKQENKKTTGIMTVRYKPLVVENGKLALGKEINREIWSEVNNNALINGLRAGDWVSIHWGWLCDVISESQVKNLEKWTKYNLALANL